MQTLPIVVLQVAEINAKPSQIIHRFQNCLGLLVNDACVQMCHVSST